MALKFAANLSFCFLEHDNFLDRYQAAKNAGNELFCARILEQYRSLINRVDACAFPQVFREQKETGKLKVSL